MYIHAKAWISKAIENIWSQLDMTICVSGLFISHINTYYFFP